MKYTFQLIHKLIELINIHTPLTTEEDKTHARELLKNIISYADSLRKLVESHKTEKYLKRLHDLHIAEIEGWTNKVSEIFKKFDQLLLSIESDAIILEKVINNNPEKWLSKVGDMAIGMIITGLHHNEKENEIELTEEIRIFKNITLFEEHELKDIIDAEEHIAELLK
ncbi:MAG: hypothetical protein WC755_03715 [Candidatus Woesearchaeota archaeon]|jgi:hypothetical protein